MSCAGRGRVTREGKQSMKGNWRLDSAKGSPTFLSANPNRNRIDCASKSRNQRRMQLSSFPSFLLTVTSVCLSTITHEESKIKNQKSKIKNQKSKIKNLFRKVDSSYHHEALHIDSYWRVQHLTPRSKTSLLQVQPRLPVWLMPQMIWSVIELECQLHTNQLQRIHFIDHH